MKKNLFDLQIFAEDVAGQAGDTGVEGKPTENPIDDKEPPKDTNSTPKYTDDDLDRIIGQKFAAWQKQQDKKLSEAERLSKMTAEEKANERIRAMEEKIQAYEAAATKAEMTKQARAILHDKNVHVNDALLSNLIADDAETTKASVESFITLFNTAVEKAVKDALKGDVPKSGSNSGITKEQILAVSNRAERQKLIKENITLFQ